MTFTCIKKNTTVRWHTIRTLHTFGDVQQNIKLTSDVLQYVWPQKWKKLNCNIDTVWYSKYYRKVTNKTGEHKKRTDAMRWRISIKKKRVTTPQKRKRKSDALRQSSLFLYIKNTKKCQILPPFSGFPPFIHNPTPDYV